MFFFDMKNCDFLIVLNNGRKFRVCFFFGFSDEFFESNFFSECFLLFVIFLFSNIVECIFWFILEVEIVMVFKILWVDGWWIYVFMILGWLFKKLGKVFKISILSFFKMFFIFFFKYFLFNFCMIIFDGFFSFVRVIFESLRGIKGRLFILERFFVVLKCLFKYFYMYFS